MPTDLLIANATVVTPDGDRRRDLVVVDERIAAIVEPGAATATQTYDATGCFAIPGGIDAHAHLVTGLGTASKAAAFGGTTTALSFTAPEPHEGPTQALETARREAAKDSVVDTYFHPRLSAPNDFDLTDLTRLAEMGARSTKIYLAYPELDLMADDNTLYRILRAATDNGILVQVHAENGRTIEAITAELLATGKHDLRYFAHSRPVAMEAEAVARTLAIAELAQAPVYLVHVSNSRSLDEIRRARARGVKVFVEVCTHHLMLDAGAYERPNGQHSLIVPPLRERADVDALWAAVSDGEVDTIASDHAIAPYAPEGPPNTFASVPYGFGGIEVRVPLILSEGAQRGVPITRLTSMLSTGPARAFGLLPRKGVIATGADADLVIWDPAPRWTVGADELHDGWASTPYDGLEVQGRVRDVFLRGRPLISAGNLNPASAANNLPAAPL